MNETNMIEKQIKELVKKINKWNYEYYQLSEPSVSDNKYDVELRKLEVLEANFPEFIQEDSPTKKVGGNIVKDFKEYQHKKPMLSLAKAYSKEELHKFVTGVSKLINRSFTFSLEPKIDGASISLHYEDGVLIRAVTRGTGLIGSDLTNNIKEIDSIPKIIDYKLPLEVRGEVYLPKSEFNKINEKRIKNNEKPFANPRNAASGTIQQLDNTFVKERKLSSIIYDVVDPETFGVNSQTESIWKLKKLGFPTSPYIKESHNFEEIWNNVLEFDKLKNSYDFDCDGFVIKVNQIRLWEDFGKTAKFPKYAIAYKFETEETSSIIKEIIPTVGRTGKISYIAEIEPVELAQTTVKRATLHNYEFIKEMNINIGDEVNLIKSGEIIPKITGLKEKNVDGFFQKTLFCPSCNSELIHLGDLVDQFCVNEDCSEKQIRKLIHFASKKALNIETLAEKNIALFYNNGILSDFKSLYDLQKYREVILSWEGFKETKIDKILLAIQNSKKTKFLNVLYGVGIKHIGLKVAEIISEKVNNFKELLNVDLKELSDINTIGPSIIEELDTFRTKNKEMLLELDNIFEYENKVYLNEGILKGVSIAITGKLSNPRLYYENLIKENGGVFTDNINKNLTYLVSNEIGSSSKTIKAQKLGVKIINENDLIKIIEKG
ncbi:DNA ligase [Mycoplasmopsis canis]|uniref:NAD-dependent DNA ligase LigA n=1 Tax=Mycoplasmopsis canis TaxID=29555 RepID=UPI000624DA4A|nr:NAD-dependent DNA ligase LigA [Mycoplasmopsis canis]AKF40849.1 DNA ligase [Mycoplasmopsis canis]